MPPSRAGRTSFFLYGLSDLNGFCPLVFGRSTRQGAEEKTDGYKLPLVMNVHHTTLLNTLEGSMVLFWASAAQEIGSVSHRSPLWGGGGSSDPPPPANEFFPSHAGPQEEGTEGAGQLSREGFGFGVFL